MQRVLTDNGACYKSGLWRDTLTTAGITHKRIRPYQPQTNGKVERFSRTLLDGWAGRSDMAQQLAQLVGIDGV